MKRRGIDVHAISSPGKMVEPFLKSEPVPFYPVEIHRRISPLHDISAIRKLYRLFQWLQPDIVQVQTPKASLLGMIAAYILRTPVRIYNVNGLLLMTAGPSQRFLLRIAERVICACATEVWCVSRSICAVMIAERLCVSSKIKVLGNGTVNGIDSQSRFNPATVSMLAAREVRMQHHIPFDATVIAFIGRIVRDKGIVELAAAWHMLKNTYDDVHLLLIGYREPRNPVPEHIWQQLTYDSRVHYAGHIFNDQLPAYLKAIDVLTLPTYREGFPIVPLEAASMEVPVVATRVAGCIDAIVDGVTGTLVTPRDPGDLARAIGRYLTDPHLRRQHGAAARARVVQEFAQEPLWNSIYQEYQRLINTARNDRVEERRGC